MSDSVITQVLKSAQESTFDEKRYAPITTSKKEMSLAINKPDTFTYNTMNDGDVTVTSSDTSVATASVSSSTNTVTVNPIDEGDTTITVNALPSTNYFGTSCPVYIHVNNRRYGIRIDKNNSNPSTRVTYIYDAEGMTPAAMNFSTGVFNYGDWGNMWFVKDNKPLMLKSDGTVGYYLNPNNYSYKEDGSASDVANTSYDGNAMAQFPLGYVYRYEDSNYEYEIISNIQYDNNYKAYAHTRADGTIADYFYWGIYGGSGSSSKIRSISGQGLLRSLTAQQEVNGCVANGSRWYTHTWSQREYIRTLLVLMGKTTNTQTAFGNGNLQNNSSAAMKTTGTLNDKGQFYGYNSNNQQVKVFHIEKFWGDSWDRIAGLIKYGNNMYIKMTPEGSGYRINDTTGYSVARTYSTSGMQGYISKVKCDEYGITPITLSGSDSTYYCDYSWIGGTGSIYYCLIGSWSSDTVGYGGAFTFDSGNLTTFAGASTGCGLTYI